ncbi:hypothetical protein BAE44_0023392, partial [Dichanthelium oligosanthes]
LFFKCKFVKYSWSGLNMEATRSQFESLTSATAVVQWKRPEHDILKINSGGAYRRETSDGGWGFVIRDHAGNVICAGAGRENHLLDAFQSEVLPCMAGIPAASHLGMVHVMA